MKQLSSCFRRYRYKKHFNEYQTPVNTSCLVVYGDKATKYIPNQKEHKLISGQAITMHINTESTYNLEDISRGLYFFSDNKGVNKNKQKIKYNPLPINPISASKQRAKLLARDRPNPTPQRGFSL